MAIIAKYKFDSSLCADYLPVFNTQFTGYTKTDVNNGDGTITRTISHDTLKPTSMRFGIYDGVITNREKSLLEVIECDTSNITNMSNMFRSCLNLTLLNTSNFDTSNVIIMASMFNSCTSLTSLDLSNFNTSKVTDMRNMFNSCDKLISLDLSSFNTGEVTSMKNMFYGCSQLTSLNTSSFNTSKVTDMNSMFNGCNKLISLDLSNFNTDGVTSMDSVFNNCPVSDIGLLYATSSTINTLLTHLGTSTARNIYYMDAPLNELTVQDNITYKKYELTMATLPYTLNKLPNGVADYIDVVNKVHVQRVERIVLDGSENWIKQHNITDYTLFSYILPTLPKNTSIRLDCMICDKINVENYQNLQAQSREFITIRNGETKQLLLNISNSKASDVSAIQVYLASNPITVLYELATPVYTPLTDEEIAQLPLSAYADGYVNLSSDQLMPSFEFRMRASNRYQVDMLETGYYYLNAPVGNVKLGTANVDVQQMPCIIKVDNVGTGDNGYRLTTSATNGYNITIPESDMVDGGYYNDAQFTQNANMCYSPTYYEISPNTMYGINSPTNMRIQLYTENQSFIKTISQNGGWVNFTTTSDTKYFRFSHHITVKKDHTLIANPITLAKLPSYRIPTSFTQGMKCATDFGYWEGIKVATGKQLYVNETNQLNFNAIELNRIEYNNTIVEDEFDIATGKLTKRIGKYTIDGSSNLWEYSATQFETATHMSFGCSQIPNFKKAGRCIEFLDLKYGDVNSTNSQECWNNLGVSNYFYFRFRKDRYSYYGNGADGVKAYFNANPTTIYYELEVPEISYVNLPSNQVNTVANSTLLQSWRPDTTYLHPQVKPSHLTYPVPSLVGNRTYTVVHNRKNITGSTKPIELNLGGTVVQLNDASSKTLVKTPSTLAHSNLIFIGGESTVDHIMVLDGDWTNKPIEYFENMMGHDTDAIITIIGNGQINDVEEQYLW